MALQTIFIKKKIKYFSFVVLLLIFIFLACLFERNISKPPENLDDGLQNYCGNEVASNFVLSYSAFGKHSWKRFGKNIENVAKGALSSSFYSKWRVRVYHDLYPLEFQAEICRRFQNVDFIDVRNLVLPFAPDLNISSINGMMWRFIPMGDSNVDIMCSRDLDSAIYPREEDAVRYWMSTGKTVHSMRDHPQHERPLMGGMWCYRSQNNRTKGKCRLQLMLQKAKKRNSQMEAEKEDDQDVLQTYLWPETRNDVIQHDAYLCNRFTGSIPFPSKRSPNREFVGCPVHICHNQAKECPKECRPEYHQDWLFC